MPEYSDYALWKMSMRNIDRDEVEAVLDDPDDHFDSATSDRHCYVRRVNGRPLEVVVESFDHNQVVTAYDQSVEY